MNGHRLVALDAFRGFAIASMVLVNNPGDWNHIYPPLAHAEWNGWTFTDLVFPFFLFAVGAAMALSVDRRLKAGDTPGAIVASLARRALVVFLIGLALSLFPAFDFSTVRIPGVLQRIALCIVIAAPFAVWASTIAVAVGIVVLLVAYSIPMLLIGTLEPGLDFGASIDRAVFGTQHLWAKSRTWDPEGLWSTLPAAASLLFGLLAGRFLLRAPGGLATSAKLLAAGVVALGAGLLLEALMPINKNLWTPSYAVFMTGWSLVAFAAFHAIGDRPVVKPFVIFGMNALFLFALSGFIGRLLVIKFGDWPTNAKAILYAPLRALPIAPENASLLFAIAFLAAMFLVAWVMWRRRWFVKV